MQPGYYPKPGLSSKPSICQKNNQPNRIFLIDLNKPIVF